MKDIRQIFENDYCGIDNFLSEILSPIFGDYEKGYDVLTADKDIKEKASQANILEIKHAATFDFFGTELKVFDITVNDGKKLENNKVGIQSIVRQYVAQFEGALIIFHHANVEDQEWRLSYVEKRTTSKDSTSAKRYTYILGKNHPAKTISDRFKYLMDRKDSLTIQDLTDAFSVEVLTKQFYGELFKWYEWACENVTFPIGDTSRDKNNNFNVHQTKEKNELNLIRLITRLMFVWFIKQKDLIPAWIFDENELSKVLKEFNPESNNIGNYYNAILQNLFFATLNKKIEERAFADDKSLSLNKQFGVKNFYRDNKDATFFKESNEQIIERFKSVPFLNGGLFECLDKLKDDNENKKNIEEFTDGFSRESEWMAFIPNILFWHNDDGEHEGLIHLLSRYNFTVEENSPTDVQVALDPELLGKVFENLLGTYNPETSETARKDSGSFYTPRQIVSFMIDESIKDYLSKNVKTISQNDLDLLFDDNLDTYKNSNKSDIVTAIKKMKVLDPACGSGAFPMGALQRIVHLIQKCGGIPTDQKSLYTLKLELIEKCLYGVDIQPIAVQICKLRFFISLICEQEKTDSVKDNYGFNPLPNLETKFVAANSLIEIAKNKDAVSGELFANPEIASTKEELQKERHNHFNAPTAEAKAECRKRDKVLREKLSKLLQEDRMYDNNDSKQLASWNPYDQNAVSSFFDAEWMFNISDGFDIVIGNPPYIQLQKDGGKLANLYESQKFKSYAKTGDIYCLFYERGCNLLNNKGRLCFITSNKWMRAGYGEKLRDYFSKNVNPKLLVDFAGVKIFESATVDTNILLFEKGKNEGKTISCTTTTLTKDGLSNLSDFVRQNSFICDFKTNESWVILSPIEQSIKSKIEAVGVPLKDWDISINYGIKTGFNDAFIVSGEKRNEILTSCKTDEERTKTAELIRPILRGRDIKRYEYNFANLYLINTHNGIKEKNIPRIDINDYPAVKAHLDSYWNQIEKRADQGDTPYNLRNCAYMDEFNKPKIVWGNLNLSATYTFAPEGMMINAPATMIVPATESLLCILNSKLADYYIRNLGVTRNGGYFEYKPMFVEQLPVPQNIDESLFTSYSQKELSNEKNIDDAVYNLYGLTKEEIIFIEQNNNP